MSKEYVKFCVKLKVARAAVTKTINNLRTLKAQDPKNIDEINVYVDTLKSQNSRLQSLNEQLDDFELDETEFSEQYSKLENYETNVDIVLAEFSVLLRSLNTPISDTDKNFIRLPKLSLPVFDGNILKWQEFVESFKAAVDNPHLSSVQKFQYLKSSLSGEAASLLEGMPLTGENFQIALNLLEERYGSKRACIRAHIRALLNLNVPNVKSYHELRSFVDKLNKHMRILETFDVVSNNYALFLVEILLIKLPLT